MSPAEQAGELAQRFVRQAQQCRAFGSPLTAVLLEGAAEELTRAGPVRDLLASLAADPPGSVPSLRFAGALHRLVLAGRAPQLAVHYPSVGGTAGTGRLWRVAREVVAHTPELETLLQAPVQTNEVGRSAALFGGLQHVVAQTGLPVRLLEVGASAGLNLQVDRFAFQVGRDVLGDADSQVRLVQPWTGSLPPRVAVEIVQRAGCDPGPLDPTSTKDRLTLTSYVWADQVARFERLHGALQIAARVPVQVQALPGSAFLEGQLAEPQQGVVTVVWHSVVWQYLAPAERTRLREVLAQAGSRATHRAPVAYLALEPRRVGSVHYDFQVRLTSWPDGRQRLLADCAGHGPPVRWH